MLLRLAVVALLGLAACSSSDAASNAEPAPPPDTSGWRMASGKEPTKAEFAALAATCEAKGGAVDNCLADLGLKRAQ
jgi:ABC-type glycerol-3-phosphate transport system substrate-binding protein